MANAIYPKYKDAVHSGQPNTSLVAAEGVTGVYAIFVDTGVYTFDPAHEFYSQLTGIVGVEMEVTGKTLVNGTFNGNDLLQTNVSGNSVEAVVFFVKNAGANTTWKLFMYMDSDITNLPFIPNSGDVNLSFNVAGVVTL